MDPCLDQPPKQLSFRETKCLVGVNAVLLSFVGIMLQLA